MLGFDLEIKKGLARIGGFHHDMGNVIEKSGIFEFRNKVAGKGGFYKAHLWHNGCYLKECSFFPAHWTKEQVAECIFEVYDNFKKSSTKTVIEKGGKYFVQEFTKEAIQLNMYITKNGIIKTSFPAL